jgi:uncharacterized protein YkwD
LTAVVAAALPASAGAARPSAASLMLQELNRARAGAGLPALRLDARMSRNAGSYTRRMARTRVLAHGSWGRRVARSSGRSAPVGEVIGWLARGTQRAEVAAMVRSWLASATHRPVVLGGSFTRVGVGRAVATLNGVRSAIYTVDFAAAR